MSSLITPKTFSKIRSIIRLEFLNDKEFELTFGFESVFLFPASFDFDKLTLFGFLDVFKIGLMF